VTIHQYQSFGHQKQKESHFFFEQANWVQGRKGGKMFAHI
jgi:hypothetical protein